MVKGGGRESLFQMEGMACAESIVSGKYMGHVMSGEWSAQLKLQK